MNKINQKFNTMALANYLYFIENHKKFSNFNTLGLYRSLSENEKLTLEEKIQVRDFAHQFFAKSFEFLQLKDPMTFLTVKTLGQDLTEGDRRQLWQEIEFNQQKILKEKRFGHRNFGDYSKHNCGYENCPYNGIMVKQGKVLCEGTMSFDTDKHYLHKPHLQDKRKIQEKLAQAEMRKVIVG